MLWALPTCKPAFWNPSNSSFPCSIGQSCNGSSHVRYCIKAVSISPLTAEGEGSTGDSSSNVLAQNMVGVQGSEQNPGVVGKEIPRYTKWTPQFARVEEVLKLLQATDDVDTALEGWGKPLSAKNIVTVLNNLRGWEKGLQFLEWLKARDDMYEVNKYTYNVVLKILRNGRQFQISEKLVDEMTSRGFEPDNFTYSTLVNCAKRCNQPEEALKWFEKMKAAGIVPDQVTYNSLIDVYGRAGRVNEAIELYEKLRSVNWKLDTVTYGAIANVYARTGDYQAIMQLFQEMKDSGARPNAVIMNTLIGALSKAGKVNQAKKVYSEMQTYGVDPTPVTLSIMIEMYTRVGAYDQAFLVYENVKKEGWKCDIGVYNSLLKACVEGGKVEEAEGVLQEIERVGCKPDHLTYRTAMNTYATRGNVEDARKMFEKVVELTGKYDTPLYTVMIRACKQAGEIKKIGEIFKEMIANGCSPDERLSGMLLSCIASAKEDEERQCILECLEKVNPSLHDLLGFLLAKNLPKDVLAGKVEDFVLQYPATSSRKPVCNSLIDICCSSGMKETAHKVFSIGVSAGAYEGLQTTLPSLWRLNLRTLSFPAAECAIEAWFSSLTLAVKEGEELPQDLIIETGVGRARTGQRLNLIVGALLKKMDTPFTENTEPAGYYCASGPTVEAWIQSKLASSEANAQEPVPALPLSEI